MLDALCGSKTVKKILLALFVNGKSYGMQLHRALKTPLTPIQQALLKLEKGGILISYHEGKTRLYQFNPAYPLLPELESLLKKAYTLLPPQEKKLYSFFKPEKSLIKAQILENKGVLLTFWKRLSSVSRVTFKAKTKSIEETGWNGHGKGEVNVIKEGNHALIFHEKGSWKGESGQEIDFSNIFRWTLDPFAGMISLDHLRRGAQNPVFLFHLVPTTTHLLTSLDSHLCQGDTYFGQLAAEPTCLRLNWRVIGPSKNEEIDYYYS